MKRTGKSIFKVCMCLLLAVTMLAANTQPVCATTVSSQAKKAVKAYQKFLSGSKVKWDNGSWTENVPAGKVSFSVVDINRDGIPELFVSYGEIYDQTGEVYTLDEQEVGGIKYLGNFNGENTSLYVEEDGRVVAVYGYMGTEVLTYLYKNGDSLIVDEQPYQELGADEDYYTTPYKIEYTYTGDGAE